MKIKRIKGDKVLLKGVQVKQEVMKIKGVAIEGISTNDSSIGEVLYIGDLVDSSIKKGMMFIVPRHTGDKVTFYGEDLWLCKGADLSIIVE